MAEQFTRFVFGGSGYGSSGFLPLIRGGEPALTLKSPTFPALAETLGTSGLLSPTADFAPPCPSGSCAEIIATEMLQKDPFEFWQEDSKRREAILAAFKKQNIPRLELSNQGPHSEPVIDTVHNEKSKTVPEPKPPVDPDNSKAQQVYREQEAAAFREKKTDSLKLPFEQVEQDEFSHQPLLSAASKPDTDAGLNTELIYQNTVEGVVSVPVQGGSTSSPRPSAPPYEAPPSYEQATQGGASSATPSAPSYEAPPNYEQVTQGSTTPGAAGTWSAQNSLPIARNLNDAFQLNPSIGAEQPANSTRLLERSGDSQTGLLEAAAKLDIPVGIACKFHKLREFHLDLIIDDSGSMNTEDTGLSLQKNGPPISRMDELKIRLKAIIPILARVSDQGITMRSLNTVATVRIPGNSQVDQKEASMFAYIDSIQPSGTTPLNRALGTSFFEALDERTATITYIFTDGMPTDKFQGVHGVDGFIRLIHYIRTHESPGFFPIGLMPCTHERECIDWMNDPDFKQKNIQVSNDYFSERDEVNRHHGEMIPYTVGLYLAAALLGPVDQTLDNLDEGVTFSQYELGEFMGYRISDFDYQRYRNNVEASRTPNPRKRHKKHKRYKRSQHSTSPNPEPIHLDGVTLYRLHDRNGRTDPDIDFEMPDFEKCPRCSIM